MGWRAGQLDLDRTHSAFKAPVKIKKERYRDQSQGIIKSLRLYRMNSFLKEIVRTITRSISSSSKQRQAGTLSPSSASLDKAGRGLQCPQDSGPLQCLTEVEGADTLLRTGLPPSAGHTLFWSCPCPQGRGTLWEMDWLVHPPQSRSSNGL